MLTSLFLLVSHELFDWSCRRSPVDLANNFGEIVKESFGVEPDLSISSPLHKGAKRLYKLAKLKKNVNKSKAAVVKCEEVNLKAFEIELGGKIVNVKDGQENKGKRKHFEDLASRESRRKRVKSVIEVLESDHGLEGKVLNQLELRKEGAKGDQDFGLACLALMKTMGISNTKYDDLRFWVQDMLRRKMDLSSMPTSKQLMEKVQAEMVPPNMTSSASIPFEDALNHHGKRIVLRLINCHPSSCPYYSNSQT